MCEEGNIEHKLVHLCFVCAILMPSFMASGADLLVPSEYATIQEAIDAAQPGDTVVLEKGTYWGAGNRDLDFGGKAITVQSSNPEDWDVVAGTVIECENSGRGFYFHSGETSSSVVTGLTIANGYAEYGGGMRCVGSSPTIRHCIFRDNVAEDGGGMENEASSATITSCIFTGNNASFGSGGGMCNYDCSGLMLTNCVFVENSAGWGGSIFNGNSSPAIVNCTFTGNSADYGGGIANYFGSNPSVTNCILWGDSATSSPEIHGDCVVSYSDVQGGHPGTDNINADPCFVDAVGGDYHLRWYSPCIDAGTNSPPGGLPETDIEGTARSSDGNVDGIAITDMGAYERGFGFNEVDIYSDDCNCINFKDFSVFAGNWLRYAGTNFALINEFDTTTEYLQGIAYDGNHVYITYGGAGAVDNVIEKREIDGTLVDFNDTVYDTTWELGGASIIDGQLYVAINGYRDHQGPEWNRIGIYDTTTLDLVEVIEGNSVRFTRDFLEGLDKHDDYYWVIFDDQDTNAVVEQYDLDWNYVAEYPLRTDLRTPCHKYQGIIWHVNERGEEFIMVNLHAGAEPQTLDKYYWDGSGFSLVEQIEAAYGHQDIDVHDNLFFWVKRETIKAYVTEYLPAESFIGDFNRDGRIDWNDLQVFVNWWGYSD